MEHPLKAYRQSIGATLDEAAAGIGMTSAATLSRIENGKGNPSADLMRRIAEWSGGTITPNDLVLPQSEAAA